VLGVGFVRVDGESLRVCGYSGADCDLRIVTDSSCTLFVQKIFL